MAEGQSSDMVSQCCSRHAEELSDALLCIDFFSSPGRAHEGGAEEDEDVCLLIYSETETIICSFTPQRLLLLDDVVIN